MSRISVYILKKIIFNFLLLFFADSGMNVRTRWTNFHLHLLRSLHLRKMPGHLSEELTRLQLQI